MKTQFLLSLLILNLVACTEKSERKVPVVSEAKTEKPDSPKEAAETEDKDILVVDREPEPKLEQAKQTPQTAPSAEPEPALGEGSVQLENELITETKFGVDQQEQLTNLTDNVGEPELSEYDKPSSEEAASEEIESAKKELLKKRELQIFQFLDSAARVSNLKGEVAQKHLTYSSRLEGLKIDPVKQRLQISNFKPVPLPLMAKDAERQPLVTAEKEHRMGSLQYFVKDAERFQLEYSYFLDGSILEVEGAYADYGYMDLFVGSFALNSPGEDGYFIKFLKVNSVGDVFPMFFQVHNVDGEIVYEGPAKLRLGTKKKDLQAEIYSLEDLAKVLFTKELVLESKSGLKKSFQVTYGPAIYNREMSFDFESPSEFEVYLNKIYE